MNYRKGVIVLKKFFEGRNVWTLAMFAVFGLMAFFAAGEAMAIAPPAAPAAGAPGAFGYDIYDVFVNSILNGPIGYVGGAAAVAYGGMLVAQGAYPLGVPAVLGGVIVLKADSITQTLGMMI